MSGNKTPSVIFCNWRGTFDLVKRVISRASSEFECMLHYMSTVAQQVEKKWAKGFAYGVTRQWCLDGQMATAEHDEFRYPMINIVMPILCSIPVETDEIRKQPICKASALQLAYECNTPEVKQTSGLQIGTQYKFIEAAKASADQGQPLNTLLSVRWVSLNEYDNSNHFYFMPMTERISYLVELIRKWINPHCRNGISYIWVRELVKDLDEHWHMGLFLPAKEKQNFAIYLGKLLGKPVSKLTRRALERTEGEFACSEWGLWHLACDTRPNMRGYYVAAYLGKGEPSQQVFRGKLRSNVNKPVRGIEFGGREKTGKYDTKQGVIRGNVAMTRRFDIARKLKKSISVTQRTAN